MERVGKRCRVLRGADKNLVDLCIRWNYKMNRTEKVGELPYEAADKLEGTVGQDEATFRIGLNTESFAKVSKDGRVVYQFDREWLAFVINPVKRLMESIGYSCTSRPGQPGAILDCNPPRQGYLDDREAMDRLADVISWAASADWRLARGLLEECITKCAEEGDDRNDCWARCLGDIVLLEREQFRNPRPDYKLHPVVESDLKKFGVTWYR